MVDMITQVGPRLLGMIGGNWATVEDLLEQACGEEVLSD